jgi:hypothetical protein
MRAARNLALLLALVVAGASPGAWLTLQPAGGPAHAAHRPH